MKILLATNSLRLGGLEMTVINLANELHSRGHQVIVFSEPGILGSRLFKEVQFVEAVMQVRNPFGLWRSASILTRLVESRKVDLIHSFSATASVVITISRLQRIFNRVTRHEHLPIIASPGGLPDSPDEHPFVTISRLRLLIHGSDRIISISPQIKKLLLKAGASPSVISDFPLFGIDFRILDSQIHDGESFREEMGIPEGVPLVATIGACHPRKSHHLFIRASVRVLQEFPEARFLVVGDGPLRDQLMQFAENLGIGSNVLFTGARLDIPRLLSAVDVYVRPGIIEGFVGITALEAMSIGKPVVVFETEDVKVAVINNETGILVPPGNSDALGAAIVALLRDPVWACRLATAGQQLVRERFDLTHIASNLERFYAQILVSTAHQLSD